MAPPSTRKSRVTILTPDNPLQLSPSQRQRHGQNNNRKEQIRRDRRTTAQRPEYMSALRRTRLHLGSNEHVREIILRVEQPLPLPTDEAREALYRRLPWLSVDGGRQDDEEAYYAACQRSVNLLTTDPSGGSWYCERIDPTSSDGEPCHVVNDASRQSCHRCGATRYCPNLRPYYSRLARLRSAVHREIRIKSTRIVQLDGELEALEEALGLANERLADLQRFVAEGFVDEADDAPESLRMLDIDITQSGSWQRTDVRALVPDIMARQRQTHRLLREIRGELCIIVQALYETAAPTLQKIIRGHLLRRKFPSIRRAIINKAEYEAATQIQRIMRSCLAKMETDHRRIRRREVMRLRIQTNARRFLARQEYKRRHAAYIEKLRHDMAVRIQHLARMYVAKTILDSLLLEKKQALAEAERQREAAAKDSSAVLIQSVARVWWARRMASQRRIELTLSDRLLHLLEKLKGDGNIHSMLSEINADYRYYHREMEQTVSREDRMAATFVDKVLKERRNEYDEAWREYHCGGVIDSKGDKGDKEKRLEAHPKRFHMYSPAPRVAASNNNHLARFDDSTTTDQESNGNWEIDRPEEMDLAGLSHTASFRFSGTSILCDIPQFLDDTMTRLIDAVAIRSLVPSSLAPTQSPDEAYRHYSNLPPGLEKAGIEAEAKTLAKPIIEQLNRMGFVYIRDAMPRANLLSLLESVTIVATLSSEAFISRCNDILTYLEKVDNVNNSTRGSVQALVSEFIESRQGICERVRESVGIGQGSADDINGSNDDDTVDSLPSGLFDQNSSEQEDIDNGIDKVDASNYDSSPAVGSLPTAKAQHDFETELDGIISVAIADVQHRPKGIKAGIIHQPLGPKTCTSRGGKRSQFTDFRGGLFQQEKNRKRCRSTGRRPHHRSKSDASSRCWAVPYTDSVRQSYPKYVKYRAQKRFLDGGDTFIPEETQDGPTNLSILLVGLPEDMQNTLKNMFEKKKKINYS